MGVGNLEIARASERDMRVSGTWEM
jgi:hypothetical protein